jgi:hypothetical protein
MRPSSGGASISRDNLDSVSETSGPPSRNGPSYRDSAATLLELPQKIEGDNWVEHGESKEFHAVAQIGNAIRK